MVLEPRSISLSLGGLGIRDIHYDTRLKVFLIITGATEIREEDRVQALGVGRGYGPRSPGLHDQRRSRRSNTI